MHFHTLLHTFTCRTAHETVGEEDEGVSACFSVLSLVQSGSYYCCAQAEEKRLEINAFLAAVLSMGSLTQAAQEEALTFLQM
jgi:hypothetical protein